MKNYLLLLLLAVAASLNACAPAVNVEKRANVDFSRYRTYAWADTKVKVSGDANPVYKDPIAQDRIRMSIDQELAQRGLRKVTGRPDFYVTTHFYIDDAERTVSNPPVGGAGYGYPYAVSYGGGFIPVNYGYYYTPAYYQTYRTEQYKQGTLIIDFIDSRTNNLVWRGSLADPVDEPGRIGSEFSKNAKEILDKFPISEKKS